MQGIEMQYTEHEKERGGLAFSQDGKTWEKASICCPELSFPRISEALGAKGTYRKARKDTLDLLTEARARLNAQQETPKEGKEDGANRQLQGRDTRTNTTANTTENGTKQNKNTFSDKSGSVGRTIAREATKLFGNTPQDGNRTDSQKSNFKTGSMEHTGALEQTGRMDKEDSSATGELATRYNAPDRLNNNQDNKLNAWGRTRAKQHVTGDKGTARAAIQWIFTDESRDNENKKSNAKSRLYTEKLREQAEYQSAFLARQKQIKEKTKALASKLASLQAYYEKKYLKRQSLKEQRRKKFAILNRKLASLQAFYDQKFMRSQSHMEEREDQATSYQDIFH